MKDNRHNLSSIYQDKHKKIRSLTNCPKQAVLLDTFIYWWQYSKFTLKNSPYIWFMRPYEQMTIETGYPLSTLKRYIKQMSDDGLIERRSTFCTTNKDGQYSVKKRTYIRITSKVLNAITNNEKQPEPSNNSAVDNIPDKPETSPNKAHNETIGKLKMSQPIYKDNNIKINNNTVSEIDNVKPVEKSIPSKTSYPIEKEIGERVTEELKNQVKGMMYNVQSKHNVAISNPNELFAQIVFALTNEAQFKGIQCHKFKINIISKKLRQNKWQTPFGFYNHWDIGQMFADKKELRDKRIKEQKEAEIKASSVGTAYYIDVDGPQNTVAHAQSFSGFANANKQSHERNKTLEVLSSKLRAIEEDIFSEGKYLADIQKHYNAGKPCVSQELIDAQMNRLASLYEQQTMVEQEIGLQSDDMKLHVA